MGNTKLTQQAAEGTRMTFEEWKQGNHPGWYLNNQQQDEELFGQYLDCGRNEESLFDIIGTLCSCDTKILESIRIKLDSAFEEIDVPAELNGLCKQICDLIIEERKGEPTL